VTQRAVGRLSPEAHHSQPPQVGWYALRVRSRFEFSVREQLRAASIEEFLPTWEELTAWSDRTNLTTRPIFPGYIFSRFSPAHRGEVLSTRGVVGILGTNGPEPIPDEQIANLRTFVESRAAVAPCAYVVGVAVRVERGPFAGVEGIVTRAKGVATLTISVEILGRSVSVALDPADVEEI
jgi:transcription antitermination factor NusG